MHYSNEQLKHLKSTVEVIGFEPMYHTVRVSEARACFPLYTPYIRADGASCRVSDTAPHLRCSDKSVNVKDCKAALLANRLGGDGISGPGAVPRSGANPGRRKHSSSCPRILLWTPLLDDVVAPIAGCLDFSSVLYPGSHTLRDAAPGPVILWISGFFRWTRKMSGV